jgi:lipoprotein-releasing system ATP-binding protein
MSDALKAAALRLDKVARVYAEGAGQLEIFSNVSLLIRQGEVVALVGQSGAGKSSLLHMAGLLEAPSNGDVIIGGAAVATLSDSERTRLRRDAIGFVYQAHHLLPEFSALENVALPQLISGKSKTTAEGEARRLLDLMGLSQRLTHRPAQLSGGEQQRVAIARALANHPRILLADEPTGEVDAVTEGSILDLLSEQCRTGVAVLVATHSHALVARADRIIHLRDGRITDA